MIYIILACALTLTGVLAFTKSFNAFSQRYDAGVTYVLTLIATFSGVLLAIAISDFEAAHNEREDLVKVLNAGMAVIDTTTTYSEALIKISPDNPDSQDPDFFVKNPPPYPDFIKASLQQAAITKNLSESCLTLLNTALINLQRAQSRVRSDGDLRLYVHTLKQIKGVIAAEAQYQTGSITQSERETRMTKALDRPFKRDESSRIKTFTIE